MSDRRPDLTPSLGEGGERALSELLNRANVPPRMRPEARQRVLETLQARLDERPAPIPVAALSWWTRAGGWTRRQARPLALALAAMLVIALGVGYAMRRPLAEHENTGPTAIRVTFIDGSVAYLDAGAKVTEIAARHVRLDEGRAFFDVIKGDGPFAVDTEHGVVNVLGTRFLLTREVDATIAAVARGVVELDGRGAPVQVRAGEWGTLRAEGETSVERAERLSHLAAWAREVMAADDAPESEPIRRGTLIAREPTFGQEWPLPIRDLTVDVHVEDEIARTTIDQTFFNHVERQLEGQFSFPLPPDAAVSRLAMYVDGKLMEGGIIERQRGRDVYESIVNRRRDPALLEWMSGNLFRVRIFPLPPRQEKRILLSYTQALPRLYDAMRIAVPIPEVDGNVRHVSFRVVVRGGAAYTVDSTSHALEDRVEGGDRVLTASASDQTIGEDLVVTLKRRADEPFASTHVDGDHQYFLARVQPSLTASAEAPGARKWVVLYDTSASRGAPDLRAQSVFLASILGELDEADEVAFVAFDAVTRVAPGGFRPVRDVPPKEIAEWVEREQRDAIGETRLADALGRAVALLEESTDTRGAPHILYLGDGIASGSDQKPSALVDRIRDKARFVGVAFGDAWDRRAMSALAEETGGAFAQITSGEDLGWRAFDLVATLNTPALRDLSARLETDAGGPVEGGIVYAPHVAAAGEPITVVARAPRSAHVGRVVLGAKAGGGEWTEAVPLGEAKSEALYLPRLWAQRRIDDLIATDDEEGAEQRQAEVTELGLANFLVTPFTSLLVLETEQMYADFKVTRSSSKGWAAYDAPATIPVVTEPTPRTGRALVLSDASGGDTVHREPIPLFTAVTSTYYGEGTGAGFGSGRGRLGGRHTDGLDISLDVTRSGEVRRKLTESLPVDLPAEDGTVWKTEIQNAVPREEAKAEIDGRFARQLQLNTGKSMGPLAPRLPAALPVSDRRGWLSAGDTIVLDNLTTVSALHYAHDERLDDLSAFVPALVTSESDWLRELVEAGMLEGERGSASVAARELWDEARARQTAERFTLPNGGSLDVDPDTGFVRNARAETSIDEEARCDGATLTSRYAELGLVVRRPVELVAPWIYAQYVPFALPPLPEGDLGFDVERTGDRVLTLTTVTPTATGDDKPAIGETLEIELDEAHRVVSLTRRLGGSLVARTQIEHGAEAIVVSPEGGTAQHLRRAGRPPAAAEERRTDEVVIDLPLRRPETHASLAKAFATKSEARRRELRMEIAAMAALGASPAAWERIEAIAKEFGAVTPGEVALASGSARHVSSARVRDVLRALPKDDRVGAYVDASHQMMRAYDGAAFRKVAPLGGLVGMLARYRLLLEAIDRGTGGAVKAYQAFVAHPIYEPLRLIAAEALDRRARYAEPEQVLEVWRSVAESEAFEVMGLMRSARIESQLGHYEDAEELLLRGFDEAARRGIFPVVDHESRNVLSYRGQVRFSAFWARHCARVVESGRPDALISLFESARVLNLQDGLSNVATTLATMRVDDPDVAQSLAWSLVEIGRPEIATIVLLPHMVGPKRAEVLRVSSTIAEREGRHARAADLLEASLRSATGGVPLSELRASYQSLFSLRVRALRAAGATSTDEPLRVAREWRALDPDNPEIDKLVADLLYHEGNREQAWRHLSSIIDRHPAEGQAYATVAETLEKQGDLDRAASIWTSASTVEPTNPTWSLRRAQLAMAQGREGEAKTILRTIDEGKYQERFSGVVEEARALLGAK